MGLQAFEWFAFFCLTLFAEIIGTVGGFGSSLFFVPLANFYFDFQFVLGITALFHVFSNVSKIQLFKEGIDWRIVKLIGIPSIIFVVIGALLSEYLSKKTATMGLGIFLTSFSVVLLIFSEASVKANRSNAMVGGALSGFLAGILGTGGALRGLTLAAFQIEKNAFIASSAIIDMGVDSARLITYTSQGYLNSSILYAVPALIMIAYLGSLIGKKLLIKIPQQLFRKISLVLILLTGAVSLYQAVFVFK